MTEEVVLPNEGTPIEGESKQSTQSPSQMSDLEAKARDMGWRPLDEFNGDEVDFIDAGEFVRRKPLFDKIEQNSKALKATRDTLEAFKTHYQKVKETEYARALTDLKSQLRDAKKAGDHDLAFEIEEAKERVEQEQNTFKAEQEEIARQNQVDNINPVFEQWISRNTWYKDAKYMRTFADEVGTSLHSKGISPEQILVEVEKAVKKEFPHKFRNSNRDNAPTVESSSSRPSKKTGALDDSFLSAQDKEFMHKFIKDGILTKEEYLTDMRKVYGVKS